MNREKASLDPWIFPTLLLWLVFFAAGMLPEATFWVAREVGGVVTQNAIINSPSLITLFLSLYLGYFMRQRCLEAGVSAPNANARAIQIGILSLIAFLPYPFHLLLAPGSLHIPGSGFFRIDELVAVFGLPVIKLLAWGYLFLIIVRYYVVSGQEVLVNMYPRIENEE